MTAIGDLDGDGVVDLAAGFPGDNEDGLNRGAVWILFLAADGTVANESKVGDSRGGFTGDLDYADAFGAVVEGLGDLDDDGVPDLAVTAIGDDDGGVGFIPDVGAVWILFLNPDGTVKRHQKISATQGGLPAGVDGLNTGDVFGHGLAALGDLDGDGVEDLAVGAPKDDNPGEGDTDRGAVWILFLRRDGMVKSSQRIGSTEGGFGSIPEGARFGLEASCLGDLDGDAIQDLAVSDAYAETGSVWILFLNADGTVKSESRIQPGNLPGLIDPGDAFAFVAAVGDLNSDGVEDLAVGAPGDDDGGWFRGAVWILLLRPDGNVEAHAKISDRAGGFTGMLDDLDFFGVSVALIGDLDGDGFSDLAVGAYGDDDGGPDRGAVWILFLGGESEKGRQFTGPVNPGGTTTR